MSFLLISFLLMSISVNFEFSKKTHFCRIKTLLILAKNCFNSIKKFNYILIPGIQYYDVKVKSPDQALGL